jgi:hypothetical protein
MFNSESYDILLPVKVHIHPWLLENKPSKLAPREHTGLLHHRVITFGKHL